MELELNNHLLLMTHELIVLDTKKPFPRCPAPILAGATGGVGRRVVERLLAGGKHVRALVRDVEKAKTMLVRLVCTLTTLIPVI